MIRRKKKKYALALSGGAALGAYQAGAVRAIYEANLDIRYVAGSSVGALNGYFAATGEVEALLDFWYNLDARKMLTLDSLAKLLFSPMTSLLSDDLQRDMVTKHVRLAKVKESGREYLCTAISLKTGKLHYFSHRDATSDKDLENFILASAAVPGVFAPVDIKGEPFMDGGLIRNTPVEPLETKTVDAVIAISMEPASYTDEIFKNTGELALKSVSIFFRAQAEDAVRRSMASRYRKAKKILLLRPEGPINMQQYEIDKKKISMLIDQGYAEAKKFIAEHKL